MNDAVVNGLIVQVNKSSEQASAAIDAAIAFVETSNNKLKDMESKQFESNNTMLIFLDCEFTDFIDCELISIGMVSEDGKHEFYAERTDYNESLCNGFVREGVLPLLGQFTGAACTRDELSTRVWGWFSTLPRHVRLASDSQHDRDLLWDAFGEGLPENLDKSVFDLRPLIDTTVFNDAVCRYHDQPGQPWHHALYDARAHRAGWMAWMDKKKDKKC